MTDSKHKPGDKKEVIDEARRRLLAKAAYVPPAVIGALALSLEGCQIASCAPAQCNPANCPPSSCNPNGGPCNPSGGPCNPNGGPCNPNGGPCAPSACGPDVCNPAP